jgi:hypothetical protein
MRRLAEGGVVSEDRQVAGTLKRSWAGLAAGVLAAIAAGLHAATTDWSDEPLVNVLITAPALALAGITLGASTRAGDRRRPAVMAVAASGLWVLGFVGVFTALFLLLVPAMLASAAALRAAVGRGARVVLLVLVTIVAGPALLFAAAFTFG